VGDNVITFDSGRYMNFMGTVISIKYIYSEEESATLLRNIVRNIIKEENEACAALAEQWDSEKLYGKHRADTGGKIASSIRARNLVNEMADDTIQAMADRLKEANNAKSESK
jgi:hypothetical protein